MSGWVDLFNMQANPLLKRAVSLVVGDESLLVWNYVNTEVNKYDIKIVARSLEDITYNISQSLPTIMVVVKPDSDMLKMLSSVITSGTNIHFIVLTDANSIKDNPQLFSVIKKNAQGCKSYYTISSPKTDAARDKMVSFFIMRWGMSKDLSQHVCAMLGYSPGSLYVFDYQYNICTDSQMVSSTKAYSIVDELLGNDNVNTVVSKLVNGNVVDQEYPVEFTNTILNTIAKLINMARRVQHVHAISDGKVSTISRLAGLTQFEVVSSIGWANAYNSKQLRDKEDIVHFGLDNLNTDTLSVVSRLW